MKRGRKYHGRREEYNVGKKGKGKQYHLFCNVKAVGKNIKWGRVSGDIMGNKNQDLKKWGWGRISSCTELYTPLLKVHKRDIDHEKIRHICRLCSGSVFRHGRDLEQHIQTNHNSNNNRVYIGSGEKIRALKWKCSRCRYSNGIEEKTCLYCKHSRPANSNEEPLRNIMFTPKPSEGSRDKPKSHTDTGSSTAKWKPARLIEAPSGIGSLSAEKKIRVVSNSKATVSCKIGNNLAEKKSSENQDEMNNSDKKSLVGEDHKKLVENTVHENLTQQSDKKDDIKISAVDRKDNGIAIPCGLDSANKMQGCILV